LLAQKVAKKICTEGNKVNEVIIFSPACSPIA
jgi:hypothetical protein